MLSTADNKLLALVGTINTVVTDPECWPDILAGLQDAFGASACAIASHHYDTGTGRLARSVNIDAKFAKAYAERYAARNVWLRRESCFRKPGQAFTDRQIVRDDEALKSEYFLNWLKPQGLKSQIFGVLDRRGNTVVYLVLARSENVEEFGWDDAGRLAAVLPAFASVFRLEHLVRNLNARATDTWTLLNHLAPGILLINDRGRIVGMNRTAVEIVRNNAGLTVDNGFLGCSLPREQIRVRQSLDELSARNSSASPVRTKAITIARADRAQPLHVILTRLSITAPANGDRRLLFGMFVSDPEQSCAPSEEWIRDLYGLTRVESQIALLICRGYSPDEIATRICVSVHTVRAYLKQIFLKLGVNRQAALVGRLIGGPGQLRINGDVGADADADADRNARVSPRRPIAELFPASADGSAFFPEI